MAPAQPIWIHRLLHWIFDGPMGRATWGRDEFEKEALIISIHARSATAAHHVSPSELASISLGKQTQDSPVLRLVVLEPELDVLILLAVMAHAQRRASWTLLPWVKHAQSRQDDSPSPVL